MRALFVWNAKALGPSSESEYFARLAQITNQQGVDGLGGNGRVAYSPGYVKQYLTDYPAISSCKLDELTLESLPKSEETKKLVNEYFLWEGDFGGKKFNQGKIFK